MKAAGSQFAAYLLQRQIRRGGDQLQQPRPLLLQTRAVIAAHRLGDKTTLVLPSIDPLDHRADRNRKTTRRTLTRQTTRNRPNNPLPQVLRIWSCHACWPPSPARSLNHNAAPKGIPRPDSFRSDAALAEAVVLPPEVTQAIADIVLDEFETTKRK
jgi:hypothetical protein